MRANPCECGWCRTCLRRERNRRHEANRGGRPEPDEATMQARALKWVERMDAVRRPQAGMTRPTLRCPHCARPIPDTLVTSAAARIHSAKGAARSGRPPASDRCPCGAMTAERAGKRGHRCEAEK